MAKQFTVEYLKADGSWSTVADINEPAEFDNHVIALKLVEELRASRLTHLTREFRLTQNW